MTNIVDSTMLGSLYVFFHHKLGSLTLLSPHMTANVSLQRKGIINGLEKHKKLIR